MIDDCSSTAMVKVDPGPIVVVDRAVRVEERCMRTTPSGGLSDRELKPTEQARLREVRARVKADSYDRLIKVSDYVARLQPGQRGAR